MVKTIIAGGRDYQLTPDDEAWLDTLGITEVVSGGATGADEGGEDWAIKRGLQVRRFPANWRQHGTAAGPIRNREMAKYAEALAVFQGGKGTDSMIREAALRGIKIFHRDACPWCRGKMIAGICQNYGCEHMSRKVQHP